MVTLAECARERCRVTQRNLAPIKPVTYGIKCTVTCGMPYYNAYLTPSCAKNETVCESTREMLQNLGQCKESVQHRRNRRW